MHVLDQAFEWSIDAAGYSIVDHKPKPSKGRSARILTGQPSGPHIVRKGGPLLTTRPLELSPTLYADFARLDGSDESCVKFATAFGYLGLWPYEKTDDHGGPNGEPLVLWRSEIAEMRRAVDSWQASPDTFAGNQELTVTQLDVTLVPIDGRPMLRIRPRSLISGIRMQFAQAVTSHLILRNCDHCGKLFELGGAGRTRKSRFCSDRCRNDFHIAKRKTTKKKGVSK